ncbi:hypothetical protein [Collimonas pratensis]|uniref:Uncharacterized protein n=1 Tax=Collimonas pratensis TaxID=279113 RepID=A0ABM5Z5S5_9BURK|nr:hypothetical protein [Collimonas pratensis]AMP14110.1 hypothetical protein CPter291_1844 [Collimonas pratensis]
MSPYRKICRLFILLFTAIAIPNAHAQTQIIYENHFDNADVPIYKSRIFTVPEKTRAGAFAIMGDKPFQFVDSDTLGQIFPGQEFDDHRMLNDQFEAATNYEKYRESSAADPFFANQRVWMENEAEVHRKLAEYTQGIHDKLKPYLIKVPVYFEGTGAFDVRLKGNVLYVFHGSLGHSTPNTHLVPIVVFSERSVTKVKVDAALAE